MRKTKHILYAAVVIGIALAFVMPGAAISNTKIYNKKASSTTPTLVSESPIQSTGAAILEEGFEGGVMPPSGWSTIDTNPTRNWDIVDAATYPDYVHTGNYAGWVNYDSVDPSDEWLISPDIDLTGYEEVTLVFWAESDTNWPGATMELHIRGDGFDDTIWDMIADEVWTDFIYREMTFDLSDYIGETINISWRYVGFDGQSFGLDDISVFEPSPEPVLEIGEISGGFGVSAVIKNTGDGEATDVNWSITLEGGLIILGKETTGTTASIPAEDEASIKSGLIFGIGKPTITVTAECAEGPSAEGNATGLVILFFVLGVS